MKRLPAHLLLCLLLLPAPAWPAAVLPARGTIELEFSPWDDAEAAILRVLQGARRAIYVQAYLFTSRPLAQALIEARARGVAVYLLSDRETLVKDEGGRSQIPRLAAAGIPVWVEVRYAAAHNKIIIVDPELASAAVVTGSYNYTYSAQARNAENLLILRGNPELARAYLDNWRRHRQDALPYPAGLSD
ncbi:phospholipase D precursor [mine drainage metagenome]|uniref:Phospholipase D n=1 Tax=mine drainage metagenome TaxID=410659 RepID=A0A1J5QM24_9ZZZZ